MSPMTYIRYSLWALIVAVVIMVTAVSLGLWPVPGGDGNTGTGRADIGAPFTLTAMTGDPYSWAPAEGGPSAIFFGFTHCPEVCPTTLYDMSGWLDRVGTEGDDIRALFITVDPERDTPEKLDSYLSAFGDRIVGLTGTTEEIDAVADAFRVYRKKVPLEGNDYTMDHSASILLFRADGSFFGTITYGEDGDTAVEKLQRLSKT